MSGHAKLVLQSRFQCRKVCSLKRWLCLLTEIQDFLAVWCFFFVNFVNFIKTSVVVLESSLETTFSHTCSCLRIESNSFLNRSWTTAVWAGLFFLIKLITKQTNPKCDKRSKSGKNRFRTITYIQGQAEQRTATDQMFDIE